jgi:hypothetical protein
MSYCRCCGQQLSAHEADAVSQNHMMAAAQSADVRHSGIEPEIAASRAPLNWQAAQPASAGPAYAPTPAFASSVPSPAEAPRWDAHLAEIFEEAERLAAQSGASTNGLQIIDIAYAMARMISVAAYLSDAGIDATTLRQKLRRTLSDRDGDDLARGVAVADLVAAMEARAIQQGARKVGIADLIAAFDLVGAPLASFAEPSRRADLEAGVSHPRAEPAPQWDEPPSSDRQAPSAPPVWDQRPPQPAIHGRHITEPSRANTPAARGACSAIRGNSHSAA